MTGGNICPTGVCYGDQIHYVSEASGKRNVQYVSSVLWGPLRENLTPIAHLFSSTTIPELKESIRVRVELSGQPELRLPDSIPGEDG